MKRILFLFVVLASVGGVNTTFEYDEGRVLKEIENRYYVSVMRHINPWVGVERCYEILDRIESGDKPLHLSIIWQETDFRDGIIGDQGRSHNYYQIMMWEARTIDKEVTRDVLMTVENVSIGSQYLETLVERYGEFDALRRYNGARKYAVQVSLRKKMIEDSTVLNLTPSDMGRIRRIREKIEFFS